MDNPKEFRHDQAIICKPPQIVADMFRVISGTYRPDLLEKLKPQLSQFPLCYVAEVRDWPEMRNLVFIDILDADFKIIKDFFQDYCYELWHDAIRFPY